MGLERMGTHSDGCYKWHLECAVARYEALRARVAELERELEGSRAIALETQLAQAQTNLDLKKRVAELERSLARRLPPNEPANR